MAEFLHVTELMERLEQADFLRRIGRSYARKFDSARHNCADFYPVQSPIEQLMLCALWLEFDSKCYMRAVVINGKGKLSPAGGYTIDTQHKICGYRVDFLVTCKDFSGESKVIIECDGHDFHEKTKEQVARDKRRERSIVASGHRLLRFSGSEIWNDVGACAQEVKSFLDNELEFAVRARASTKEKPRG